MPSFQEVLNFTIYDLQSCISVDGWSELTSEQQEQCILKIRRDLERQRNENYAAVDANELENRLRQLERSRSPTPRSPTPPPPPFDHDDPQLIASDREVELKAHEALVSDNGRPCYPIKLGFKVFKDPAQYKDIFEYWQGERGITYTLCRWIFHVQLERWEKFRQFQQKTRNEFGSCEKFAEFRQELLERRRRYGLDGDIQLLKEANEQKRMDEWMEYQDYELQKYEAYEKQLELFQKNLAAAHDELSKIRGSVLEDVPKLASGGFFTSAFSHNSENARIVKERELAERKLRIAEKRLEVAESIAPAESVKRATWVALFSETVDSKKLQVDESKRLVEIAENELKPLEVWFQSKRNEWVKERKENPEEAERNDGHAADSVEFRNQMKELKELEKKYSAAKLVRSRAEKGLAFAEECYKSTSLDNLGESINRADLINMMLEEIRPAKTRCEHSKESYKKVELDRRIPGLQHGIAVCQGMMKRHKILLDWVEAQRLEIFNEEDGVQQSKEATSKGPRKRSASGQSAPHESPKALSFQRTQPTTSPIIGSVNAEKTTQEQRKSQSPCRKTNGPSGASQATERALAEPSILVSSSKEGPKIQKKPSANLGPAHPSKVFKSKLSSQDKKAHQPPLRRSTRKSKPPERFIPG